MYSVHGMCEELSEECTLNSGMSITTMAAWNETPSGIPIDEVGSLIEQWASENENEYPSFAVAVVNGDEGLRVMKRINRNIFQK